MKATYGLKETPASPVTSELPTPLLGLQDLILRQGDLKLADGNGGSRGPAESLQTQRNPDATGRGHTDTWCFAKRSSGGADFRKPIKGITVSAGFGPNATKSDLMAYEAKRAGKNRLILLKNEFDDYNILEGTKCKWSETEARITQQKNLQWMRYRKLSLLKLFLVERIFKKTKQNNGAEIFIS